MIIEERKEYLTKLIVKQFLKIVENAKVNSPIYRCVSAKQNGEWMVGIIFRNTIAIVFSEFFSLCIFISLLCY
jgi:hypothetical protein